MTIETGLLVYGVEDYDSKENYYSITLLLLPSLVAQAVKASAYNAGDPGLIPGSGRSPGEGNGNPCLVSHTDHVPLEAMNIELSRQESVSRL